MDSQIDETVINGLLIEVNLLQHALHVVLRLEIREELGPEERSEHLVCYVAYDMHTFDMGHMQFEYVRNVRTHVVFVRCVFCIVSMFVRQKRSLKEQGVGWSDVRKRSMRRRSLVCLQQIFQSAEQHDVDQRWRR